MSPKVRGDEIVSIEALVNYAKSRKGKKFKLFTRSGHSIHAGEFSSEKDVQRRRDSLHKHFTTHKTLYAKDA